MSVEHVLLYDTGPFCSSSASSTVRIKVIYKILIAIKLSKIQKQVCRIRGVYKTVG